MDSQVGQSHSRAKSLAAKFVQGDGSNYIDEAILLDREALALCPPGHRNRSASLNCLAAHLMIRYDRFGGRQDLEETIILHREALQLHPPGHPNRSVSLNNLAIRLSIHYKLLGVRQDLDEAIILHQEALQLRPQGHSNRSATLNHLAIDLSARYELLGRRQDLDEAIVHDREALQLRPQGHPDRSASMNNLAAHLSTRYKVLRGRQDLDEAIALYREALQLHPKGHPNQSILLTNLAANLWAHYDLLGDRQDLDEAIVLDREALLLPPPGHPGRWAILNNLAVVLSTCHQQLGEKQDLDEAIILHRETLQLLPQSHPDRSASLNNLAIDLSTRHSLLGDRQDLDDAIVLDREALQLYPQGHPNRAVSLSNLAARLSTCYKMLRRALDPDEVVYLDREALHPPPQARPKRSALLNNLVTRLSTCYKKLRGREDLDLDGFTSFIRARSQLRLKYKEELFSVYAELVRASPVVSSGDLSAVRAWIQDAECFCHPSMLLAYETYLRMLARHLASLPSLPQHLSVIKKATASLAVDPFSACLRNSVPACAVELIEQGRGVFWNQLTRLRSPLDDVIASGPAGKTLADEFTHVTSLIHDALKSPGADQHGQLCHLNLQLETVVDSIRALPGLSRFLLPPSFADLQLAASGGPVIILNSSQYGRDAVVIFLDRDPVHIPLQITRETVLDLSKEIQKLSERAKRSDMMREFASFLRRLWDEVVSPIIDFLQTCVPIQSRIWWCPTAEFSVLPLHAAGPYRKGQKNLPHLYVSSYTPTLGALIRTRRQSSSKRLSSCKRFVAVGQANAIGESQLVSVSTELVNIGQRVSGLTQFTQIEGPESSMSRVAEELGNNEWVHLACHGLANQQKPFESAFALCDGHFTIKQIIRCELENPEFAYLSACHTTVGDEESLDEVIHLASGMQFVGFRSVIGTMWAVDDGETNKITSMFYSHLVDGAGRLDHTCVAYALNKTMRNVDVPLDQRILYIHLGT